MAFLLMLTLLFFSIILIILLFWLLFLLLFLVCRQLFLTLLFHPPLNFLYCLIRHSSPIFKSSKVLDTLKVVDPILQEAGLFT